MTPTDQHIRDAIAQQAAEWFVTNQGETLGESLGERERVAFMRWLRSSPAHVEEYLRVAALSRDLGSAAADPSIPIDEWVAQAHRDSPSETTTLHPLNYRPERPARLWPLPGWLIGGVTTAIVVLIALVSMRTGPDTSIGPGTRHATAHAQQRTWTLADGSTVQLNGDSEVWERFNPRERVVVLVKGQAYFEVVKDSARRFRVQVASADVVAVGTQFDIYRQEAMASVTVIEGRTAVYSGGAQTRGTRSALPSRSIGAGERVTIDSAGEISVPVKINLGETESWRTGRIVFEHKPLGQVVSEFNRYATVPIDVSDPALRDMQLSGAFAARDTDSFVAYLQTLDGITVQRDPHRILIGRR